MWLLLWLPILHLLQSRTSNKPLLQQKKSCHVRKWHICIAELRATQKRNPILATYVAHRLLRLALSGTALVSQASSSPPEYILIDRTDHRQPIPGKAIAGQPETRRLVVLAPLLISLLQDRRIACQTDLRIQDGVNVPITAMTIAGNLLKQLGEVVDLLLEAEKTQNQHGGVQDTLREVEELSKMSGTYLRLCRRLDEDSTRCLRSRQQRQLGTRRNSRRRRR
jgi:hypothetical protein